MKPASWSETLTAIQEGDATAISFVVRLAERYADTLSGETMEWYRDGLDLVPIMVHKEKPECAQGCCVHHPSDHHMRDWPTIWRNDRGLMERACEHGVGHPDPDSIAFIRRTDGLVSAVAESVHGCDGCCRHD